MKTKIASLCAAAVFSILAFATSSSAAEEGFYDKDHIRGFVSFGADFRGMTDAFNDYVNKVAFAGLNGGTLRHKADTSSSVYRFFPTPTYNTFNQFYPALHFNIGAQYKQFLTWFDINFAIRREPGRMTDVQLNDYVQNQTIPEGMTAEELQEIIQGIYDAAEQEVPGPPKCL